MDSHDYIMGSPGDVSDRLRDANDGGSFGGADARGVDGRGIEDLLFDSGSQRYPDYRTPAGDPHTEAGSFWPSYHLYQPEMAPPAPHERLLPPPAAYTPELQPEPVRYEDGLMTQALFDWSMRNLPETPAMPFDDWI